MSKFLIIIPAYNEANHINQVLSEIRKFAKNIEIVIIDDGSVDQTSEIIKNQKNLNIVHHSSNLGYGAALQTGFKYAVRNNYDYVIQMDADGQHRPEYIPYLIENIKNNSVDIVVGSRFLKSAGYKIPFIRKIGMLTFSKIVSLLIKQKITDPTSGFRIINSKVAKFCTSEIYPTDFPDADVIIMLKFAGARIKEVPIEMRASLKKNSMHEGLKPLYYIFKMFFSIFLTLVRERKQL